MHDIRIRQFPHRVARVLFADEMEIIIAPDDADKAIYEILRGLEAAATTHGASLESRLADCPELLAIASRIILKAAAVDPASVALPE